MNIPFEFHELWSSIVESIHGPEINADLTSVGSYKDQINIICKVKTVNQELQVARNDLVIVQLDGLKKFFAFVDRLVVHDMGYWIEDSYDP